jgi:hypothetical protein
MSWFGATHAIALFRHERWWIGAEWTRRTQGANSGICRNSKGGRLAGRFGIEGGRSAGRSETAPDRFRLFPHDPRTGELRP